MKKVTISILVVLAVFTVVTLYAQKKTENKEIRSSVANVAKAEVFFTKDISPNGLMKAFEKIRPLVKGKRIGLKVHFGEDGNKYYIKPAMMKDLVKSLNSTFVETNVLYVGKRRRLQEHLSYPPASWQ